MSDENYSKKANSRLYTVFVGSSCWYDCWYCSNGLSECKLVYPPETVQFPANTQLHNGRLFS